MNYLATGINESPVITGEASTAIADVRGRAVKFSSGKIALAGAGEMAVGIGILTNSETIAAGEDVHVQISACGLWEAGGEIAVGDALAADANGKAVTAQDGDFILAVALEAAEAAGRIIKVQIIKAGYAGGAAPAEISMEDLADVDLTGIANGKILKYNSTSSKWECKDDAVTG